MSSVSITLGSPYWLLPAAAILAASSGILVHAYVRGHASRRSRWAAAALKGSALLLLAACLLEPLVVGSRARPRSNLLVILADDSESLNVTDPATGRSRADSVRDLLRPGAPWLARLEEDFDVRKYLFDSRLRTVDGFDRLSFEGKASSLHTAISALSRQFSGRPLAGVILLTDGIATDGEDGGIDGAKLPPLYPVLPARWAPPRDIELKRVVVSETLFEAAPLTVQAEVRARGCARERIVVQLLDTAGRETETVEQVPDASGRILARFQIRTADAGVHFYRVRAALQSELATVFEASGASATGGASPSSEGTLANNERLVAVRHERGPHRVLYVSGRPNWEFKFLRRAIDGDPEIDLVGLIRIAKREPKFEFRGRSGESTNPLFRGFGKESDEETERYDQPVLLRIGKQDGDQLRDGFPKSPEQLYAYDAVILDDVEAEYFTRDQLSLIRSFVSKRGGGFLMLGGQESFAKGGYSRTPIEEILPVYLDAVAAPPRGADLRLSLTREGWVQPWVRLHETEEAERLRIDGMPSFRTLNPVRGIKPGATVLAQAVVQRGGEPYPALVAQNFGRGRATAMLLGDLWRWALRRRSPTVDDPDRAWRQVVRWLVSDVPRRVEARASEADSGASVRLAVRVLDELHEPLDGASVLVEVSGPAGDPLKLTAEPAANEAGLYEVRYDPQEPGGYRALATARALDGSEIGADEIGWTFEPTAREYRRLDPDREVLERLARESGGKTVESDGLPDLAGRLPLLRVPISESWITPLWHRWWVFLVIILCLAGEWALRRWKGMP